MSPCFPTQKIHSTFCVALIGTEKKKNALIDEHESAGVSTEATKGTKTQTAAGERKAGIKAWNRRGMERK